MSEQFPIESEVIAEPAQKSSYHKNSDYSR